MGEDTSGGGSSATDAPAEVRLDDDQEQLAALLTSSAGGSGDEVDDGTDDPSGNARSVLSARIALGAFVAYLVVAFFLLLFHFGDGLWFGGDDWGFLDGRSLWSVDDLMRPHNGHLVALPVAVYQVLYRIFGVRTYVPYMIGTIVLHLVLCALVRVVMRRAGAGPWIATIAAGTLVLLGSGYENLIIALQITLVGSMVFGFTHLLLADHDGPISRRDYLGLGAGFIGLLCSAIAPAMVATVGIAVLLRRGWRQALFHTVPLGLVFVAWAAYYTRTGGFTEGSGVTLSPITLADWVRKTLTVTFEGIGQHPLVAIALLALIVVGGALAISARGWADARRTLSAPVALLIGAALLEGLIGTQRVTLAEILPQVIDSARYIACTAAMVLPAIAIGGAELIRRWRVVAPVVVVLLLLGVPGNINAFDGDGPRFFRALAASQRPALIAIAKAPAADRVPEGVFPDPHALRMRNLTVGFVRFADKQGKLPDSPTPTDQQISTMDARLRLSQSAEADAVPGAACETLDKPIEVEATVGERFVLGSPVSVSMAKDGGGFDPPVGFVNDLAGAILTSNVDQAFKVGPARGKPTFIWCTVP